MTVWSSVSYRAHCPRVPSSTEYFLWTAKRGMVDVTPRGLQGGRAVGIDALGRIAVVYEDENPLNTRSVVLVPRGL